MTTEEQRSSARRTNGTHGRHNGHAHSGRTPVGMATMLERPRQRMAKWLEEAIAFADDLMDRSHKVETILRRNLRKWQVRLHEMER